MYLYAWLWLWKRKCALGGPHTHTHTYVSALNNNENKEIYSNNILRNYCCFCCVDAACMCKQARLCAHNKGWVWFALFCFVFFCATLNITNAKEGEKENGRMRYINSIHRNHVGLHMTIIQNCVIGCVCVCVFRACIRISWLGIDKHRNWKTVSLMMFRIHHRQSIVYMCVCKRIA